MFPTPTETAFEKIRRAKFDLSCRGESTTQAAEMAAQRIALYTRHTPISVESLQAILGVSDRSVKKAVEELRMLWKLPIGSSKGDPSGYYWIHSVEEFKEWLDRFLAQPKREFSTAHTMARANFPELAGQINFLLEDV